MGAKPWIAAGAISLALVACAGGAYAIANNLVRDSIQTTASSALEKEITDRLGANANVDVKIGSGSALPDMASGKVKDVSATITMDYDALLDRLHDDGLTQVTKISGSGDTLTLGASYEVGGADVPVTAKVRLVPDGGTLKAEVVSVEALGKQIDAKDLPKSLRQQIASANLPIPALPEGIDISKITGDPNGVKVDLYADEIDIDTLRGAL